MFAGVLRRAGSRVALGVAGLILALMPATLAGASSETVIGFDDLTPATVVTNQYEVQGLRFGFTKDFGQVAQSGGDCGGPSVASGAGAHSEPNYAILASCSTPSTGAWSGTFGALSTHPHAPLAVDVRDLTAPVAGVPPASVKVVLIGFDASGKAVAEGEGVVTQGVSAWTSISAINLAGAAPQVSYFAIRTAQPNGDTIAIDDLSFEKVEEGGGGSGGGGTGGGGGSEGGGSSGGSSGGGGAPSPPIAALSLQTASPHAGEVLTLSGAGSQPGSGPIISYNWDFNNDGGTDTSTGTNPVAHFMMTPGPHTVALSVTNSNGLTSVAHLALNIPGPAAATSAPGGEGPCQSSYEDEEVHIIADCIQKLAGGGYVIQTRALDLNGMVLTPRESVYGTFKILPFKRLGISSGTDLVGPVVNIELLNTPIGDMVLGGRDLTAEPIELTSRAFHPPTVVLARSGPRARVAEESKKLLMSFGVGHTCSSGEKKVGCCPPSGSTTACATLPGGFPLTGQINVYLNDKGQTLFDVQVGLDLSAVNFQATGELEIVADLQNGINLNSLKFAIPEAGLGAIFKVKNASFTYYFPSDPDASKRDTWQAKATVIFGPMEEPALEGELSFRKGQFHSAALVLTLPPGAGVPLYPGIELNKLGASVGVEPFAFGGTLGARIATQLQLTLEFKFREATSSELGFFGGKGSLAFKGDEIASLAADVFSDGYVDAQVKFDIHFPFESSDPVVKVSGEAGFWDEPSSGLWQAQASLALKVWVIEAEVAALVNNLYIAGCLEADGAGVQGRYRFSDGNIDGGVFAFSNCSDQLKQYKQKPLTEHKGGFVGGESAHFLSRPLSRLGGSASALGPLAAASAAENGSTFAVPSGKVGEGLRISSSSGTPIVTLTSPGGQTYTTPASPSQVAAVQGQFIAAVAPNHDQVLVMLVHPNEGTWRIKAAPGSAPIAQLEAAEDVAPATVRVRVHHPRHGRAWSLAYAIGNHLAGTRVRFVERGSDSVHVLATVANARGAVRFVPQEALGRARTITAYLLDSEGATVRALKVARYTAPAVTRPGRPPHLRFQRRGSTVVVSWGRVAGARVYRVRVRGSDGRLKTFFAMPSHRSEVLPNVLPAESFNATVTALGGPGLLAGRPAAVKLAAMKQRHARKRRGTHKRKH